MIIKVLFGILSTACLLSLSFYIYLAYKGNSLTLRATMSSGYLSFIQKTFLLLAMFGFFVCMYKGAEAMLFWMPDDWGGLDSEGDFEAYKESLAIMFVTFGGLAFAYTIDKLTHKQYCLEIESQMNKDLEKILNVSTSEANLESYKKEYLEEIKTLENEISRKYSKFDFRNRHLLTEEQKIRINRQIIATIDYQKEKIRSYREDVTNQ